jgi:hypothetical protein
MESDIKRNYDFWSRIKGENKRKQIAQKIKGMVEIIVANR